MSQEGDVCIKRRYAIERMSFLASSIAIIFTILLISNQPTPELPYIEEDLLLQVEEENRRIKKENDALVELLFNQAKMCEWANKAVENMDITLPSGFSEANLGQAFSRIAPGLVGMEATFILVEKEYGINCLIPAAIAILESGGGISAIANNKNNLCGLGAHDNAPERSAMRFNTCDDSILYLGEILATHYAPGGKYYGGKHTLKAINKKYAKDKEWAQKVARIVSVLIVTGINNPEDVVHSARIKRREECEV